MSSLSSEQSNSHSQVYAAFALLEQHNVIYSAGLSETNIMIHDGKVRLVLIHVLRVYSEHEKEKVKQEALRWHAPALQEIFVKLSKHVNEVVPFRSFGQKFTLLSRNTSPDRAVRPVLIPYIDPRLALMISWFNANKYSLVHGRDKATKPAISTLLLNWLFSVIDDFVEPEDRLLILSILSRTAASPRDPHHPYRRLSSRSLLSEPVEKAVITSGTASTSYQHRRRLVKLNSGSELEVNPFDMISSASLRPRASRKNLEPPLLSSTTSPRPSHTFTLNTNSYLSKTHHAALLLSRDTTEQPYTSHSYRINSQLEETPLIQLRHEKSSRITLTHHLLDIESYLSDLNDGATIPSSASFHQSCPSEEDDGATISSVTLSQQAQSSEPDDEATISSNAFSHRSHTLETDDGAIISSVSSSQHSQSSD